ncbi:MAG: sigma-70 family RNA polymerase sigma factor [Candidatus Eremiobacteraeota bacterium]|nr:sigma-70 family RNA polymerase sigma factor [Candidatus Eremiobacteraeota bacterium]
MRGDGLERLIIAVWPEAYRIAFSILRDGGLAEDAAQEACATMARQLHTLKNTGVFNAWSYKIIVNHAITAATSPSYASSRPDRRSRNACRPERCHGSLQRPCSASSCPTEVQLSCVTT